jgi:hypothetical protein
MGAYARRTRPAAVGRDALSKCRARPEYSSAWPTPGTQSTAARPTMAVSKANIFEIAKKC